MKSQPYTTEDLARGEQIVRELHGLKGFDAWAERIAKEIASTRASLPVSPAPAEPSEDTVRRMRSEDWPDRQDNAGEALGPSTLAATPTQVTAQDGTASASIRTRGQSSEAV